MLRVACVKREILDARLSGCRHVDSEPISLKSTKANTLNCKKRIRILLRGQSALIVRCVRKSQIGYEPVIWMPDAYAGCKVLAINMTLRRVPPLHYFQAPIVAVFSICQLHKRVILEDVKKYAGETLVPCPAQALEFLGWATRLFAITQCESLE